MNLYSTIGLISTVALFLPVLLILVLKLFTYRTFPALLFYYSTVVIYNLLTEGYIPASTDVIYYWGLANNLLDIPLMLYFLTYLSPSKQFTSKMWKIIFSFMIWEAFIIAILGFNINAITIILAPGLPLIVGYCAYFFSRKVKIAIEHPKAAGKALMATGLLFAYCSYTIIYLLYYVFQAHLDGNNQVRPDYVQDTFLVYFMSTIISSLLVASGIFLERKRIHKLNELKITRKELLEMYPDTKRTDPFRTVLLDFDKELLN